MPNNYGPKPNIRVRAGRHNNADPRNSAGDRACVCAGYINQFRTRG
jgi:hypothetical protein